MSVASKKRLLEELKNKKFRDAYVAEHVKTSVPIQIFTLREQRNWSQSRLAELGRTTQTVISRLEDPDYGKFTIASLLKIASAFDVALLVKFVPFTRLLDEFKDTSTTALSAPSFTEEFQQMAVWAEAHTQGESVERVDHADMTQASNSTSGFAELERWREVQQNNPLFHTEMIGSYIETTYPPEGYLESNMHMTSDTIKLTIDQ